MRLENMSKIGENPKGQNIRKAKEEKTFKEMLSHIKAVCHK